MQSVALLSISKRRHTSISTVKLHASPFRMVNSEFAVACVKLVPLLLIETPAVGTM